MMWWLVYSQWTLSDVDVDDDGLLQVNHQMIIRSFSLSLFLSRRWKRERKERSVIGRTAKAKREDTCKVVQKNQEKPQSSSRKKKRLYNQISKQHSFFSLYSRFYRFQPLTRFSRWSIEILLCQEKKRLLLGNLINLNLLCKKGSSSFCCLLLKNMQVPRLTIECLGMKGVVMTRSQIRRRVSKQEAGKKL